MALQRAIERDDVGTAETITWEMRQVSRSFMPPGGFPVFSRYNIPLENIRIDAAGYMKAGPCRPPYHVVPQEYAEGARKSGAEWKALRARYAAVAR